MVSLLTQHTAHNIPMSNFEWQTEDSDHWIDDPVELAPQPKRPTWRIAALLGFLVLIAAVVGSVYWRLQATVDDAVAAAEAELEATSLLLYDSAENADLSLFVSFLSGSDPDWAAAYQQQVADGTLFDLSAFGLEKLPAAPVVTAVELSPDLFSAEVTSTLHYAFDIGNGLTETVELERPNTYRKGQTRWLFAPPDDQYWGDTIREETSWGQISFPARDAAIVRRIVSDVSLAHAQLCRQPADPCDNDTRINFSTAPADLLAAQPSLSSFLNKNEHQLPAPSLIGLPSDNLSLQALKAGYARLMLRTIFASSLRYDGLCCDQPLYFDGLIELMLVDEGFVSEQFSAEQYADALSYSSLTFFEERYRGAQPYSIAESNAMVIWLDYFFGRFPTASKVEGLDFLYRSRIDSVTRWMHVIAANSSAAVTEVSAETFAQTLFAEYQLHLLSFNEPSATRSAEWYANKTHRSNRCEHIKASNDNTQDAQEFCQ